MNGIAMRACIAGVGGATMEGSVVPTARRNCLGSTRWKMMADPQSDRQNRILPEGVLTFLSGFSENNQLLELPSADINFGGRESVG